MRKFLPISMVAAVALFGAAYKIPEQSLNSTALAGAYVSHTTDADSAYFNPANMAFLANDAQVEFSFMGIHLTPIKNETTRHETHKENFLTSQFFAVSRPLGKWRIGFAFTQPGGLAKRWNSAPEDWSANRFSLRVFEANPSVSYKINDKFAVAAGIRYVYTDGKIDLSASPQPTPDVSMDADGHRFGYNLALSYKPLPRLGMAVTYRSKIDLKEDGLITFPTGFAPLYIPAGYTKPANVTVPLPATLSIAAGYTFAENTTVELEYEKAYWSSYKELFIHGYMTTPKPKNWKDSNTFRMGITQKISDKWKVMAGYAYDETPIPDATLSYELPDSDANMFSIGVGYKINKSTKIGAAYLYDKKKSRTVTNANMLSNTGVPNTTTRFRDAAAHLVNFSVGYKF